jgi:Protein of unknown function (DUF5672)
MVRVGSYSRNEAGRVVDAGGSVVCEMHNGYDAGLVADALNGRSRLSLPDVTLVIIETQEHELAKLAVQDCLAHVDFADVLIFTDKPEIFNGIGTIIPVPNWPDKLGWSKFHWHGIHHHIHTSHVLTIQWDSWVIDPRAWKDEFLKYDVVGAPWWYEENNVGGLGFGLRSRRLLDYLSEHERGYPINTDFDDDLICRRYRPALEREGFTWAPTPLAFDFAFECIRPPSVLQRHFGFHGIGNWPLVLDWNRLSERVAIARASQYLQTSGHLASLNDLLLRYAQEHAQRVEDLNKNKAEGNYFSAIRRFRNQDYVNGLPEYECRWDTKWFNVMKQAKDRFEADGIKQWKGEPLDGKRILMWHEQGHGDSIMMQRYIPRLERLAEHVYVGVPPPLVDLFKYNGHDAFPQVHEGIEADYHCPMFSLPLAFGTTADTVPLPVMRAPLMNRKTSLANKPLFSADSLNVGITWLASDKFPHNEHRSIDLDVFFDALDPRMNYIALQYGIDLETKKRALARGIRFAEYEGFLELASIMMELDLVISVCTATINLAGSIGVPSWVLLSNLSDMRWGRNFMQSSPWYPDVTMFRQKNLDDWKPVIDQVRLSLAWEMKKYMDIRDGTLKESA